MQFDINSAAEAERDRIAKIVDLAVQSERDRIAEMALAIADDPDNGSEVRARFRRFAGAIQRV